jgi:trimeric autotransporter adhesin
MTASPTHALQVTGTAGLSTGTAWTNTSDIRVKDVHGDYEYGLDEIMKLHTVRFNYKKDNPLGLPSDVPMTGFIAQEVQPVIPDAVKTDKDGYLSLNVDPIHWATVNAVQELHRLYEGQQAEIDALKAENTELKVLAQEVQELKNRPAGGGDGSMLPMILVGVLASFAGAGAAAMVLSRRK